jgi:hypothetical protein
MPRVGAAPGSARLAFSVDADVYGFDCRWQWYSTIVGFREIDCVGDTSQQGTVTQYQTYIAKNCTTSGAVHEGLSVASPIAISISSPLSLL